MKKKEFFFVANSFPAPFFSEDSHGFICGTNLQSALEKFMETYDHPAGLHSVALYKSADSFHKEEKPLLEQAWVKRPSRSGSRKKGNNEKAQHRKSR